MRYAHDPHFKFIASRALYKGILRYTATMHGDEYVVQPLPVHAFAIDFAGNSKVLVVNGFQRIDGPAVINTAEQAGFDLTADPGVPYIGTTAYSGLQYEFDRSKASNPDEALQLGATGDELAGTYMAGNTMDYATIHGASIMQSGYSFVSCSRQAFEEGVVKPQAFDVIDVYMGLQRERGDAPIRRSTYYNMTPAMYNILTAYTQCGGALLISGSYLGEESQELSTTRAILHDVMHARYGGNITDWSEQGIRGLGTIVEIPRWINPEHYPVVHPEVFIPADGAFTPFAYEHSRRGAAVAYAGTYRSVLLGFPFEAIRSSQDRHQVMVSLLDFLTKRQ